MKKKLLCFLLALALVMSLVPLTAFGENGGVPYLDANGNSQTADHVTELTEGGLYVSGWYILRGTQSLGKITFAGSGEVHLILENGADVTVDGGILINDPLTSITIYGQPTNTGDIEGKLTTIGTEGGAGIGSGSNHGSCGNITINGGTVVATGSQSAAGIGSGDNHSSCDNITINGGTVTATGGEWGAGIGTGNNNSRCGTVTVNGGTVTANCGDYGAGIGAGYNNGFCDDITINGGVVIATGGVWGAGIGSGYDSNCDNITITGGCVTAIGDDICPGIGSGYKGRSRAITISGSPVIRAGINAERAQIVSEYSGQRYVNVMYVLGGASVTPGSHIHLGTPQTAATPRGKTVTYYRCDCEKLFEDLDCTIEITNLEAWLAECDSGDIALSSDNGNPPTGITGNGTFGIILMIAFSIGLILFAVKI